MSDRETYLKNFVKSKDKFQKEMSQWTDEELQEHASNLERFYRAGSTMSSNTLGDFSHDPNYRYHWHTLDGNDTKMHVRQALGWTFATQEDALAAGISPDRLAGDSVVEMSHNSHRAVLLKIPRELDEFNRRAKEKISKNQKVLDSSGQAVSVTEVEEDKQNVVRNRREKPATV